MSRFTAKLPIGLVALIVCSAPYCCRANERNFTYTYEPETLPKGGLEYEQWVTLRAGRNAAVGQDDFNLWEFRHEFEYGLADNYTVSLYVNHSLENFNEPGGGGHHSHYAFDGVSLENRYLAMNPVDHAVGLALYLEPRYSGDEAELEQKIILGQRYGDWKWALNLTHATEWEDDFRSTEGEVELSLGVIRRLGKHWSLGVEARDHNELPEYSVWENTAFYLGPVVSYQREKWWATLTVMPQVFGANFQDNPSRSDHLELEGHERWNVRLIFGFGF
ncbi:MAG TPA: DUF6662 family protein [Verrucomicrobiae bacterium]